MVARLAPDEGALAFNCSGDRDRAGMVSVLILSVLGAPRETVLEDNGLTEAYTCPRDRVPDQLVPPLPAERTGGAVRAENAGPVLAKPTRRAAGRCHVMGRRRGFGDAVSGRGLEGVRLYAALVARPAQPDGNRSGVCDRDRGRQAVVLLRLAASPEARALAALRVVTEGDDPGLSSWCDERAEGPSQEARDIVEGSNEGLASGGLDELARGANLGAHRALGESAIGQIVGAHPSYGGGARVAPPP